ncbi:hypothetical protein AVEN_126207-1 [Araneus ventricosus]|uniref:Uncharacterized protein n=1 Tax=Araneus ventricosus TaxID=182803 RepID=A0A4Y2IVZ0_ARAVE|nr:hypothetical protein AVEN_126207-1 [Araneus ventricosus]
MVKQPALDHLTWNDPGCETKTKKQKLEILQKLDNGESASTDAEDALNEGNTISHSASLQSVETLLDYMDKEDLITVTLLRFLKYVSIYDKDTLQIFLKHETLKGKFLV